MKNALEADNNKYWKDLLVKENEIKLLNTQCDMKEKEKQSLEHQIKLLEEKALKHPIELKVCLFIF